MLSLGGGPNPRRFQQSSKYIFTMDIMKRKREVGGVAYAAQKSIICQSLLWINLNNKIWRLRKVSKEMKPSHEIKENF
jgi:hypothetical protein